MAVKKGFRKTAFSKKKKNEPLQPGLCALCGKESDDNYLGKLFITSQIIVHENCLLFSPLLHQVIDPDKRRSGYIIGFKIADIEREVKRILPLRCRVCHSSRAGIGCFNTNCRKSFHLCCGLKNGAVGIFNDIFPFYCNDHAPEQDLKLYFKACGMVVPECTICLESLVDDGYDESSTEAKSGNLWTQFLAKVRHHSVIHGQCCSRCWMHRTCMRQYGLSAGLHHVKCPHCGDRAKFIDSVKMCGIWLPDRDASWELEPGAYRELYEPPQAEPVTECEPVFEREPTPEPEPSHSQLSTDVVESVETQTHNTQAVSSPTSRKRTRPSEWSSKSSPSKPVKRRRTRSKPNSNEGLLVRRVCARCDKNIVSLNCKNLATKNQVSVLKEANLNQESMDSDREYVCVSCHK